MKNIIFCSVLFCSIDSFGCGNCCKYLRDKLWKNEEDNTVNNEVKDKKTGIKTIKILVVGDPETGKTSFIDKICSDRFNEKVESTISNKLNYKKYTNKNGGYMFEFNDLGARDFNIVIDKIIFKSINAIIYCCSPDKGNESLKNILKWNKFCFDIISLTENVPKFIVINKCDLDQKFKEEKINEVKKAIAKKYYYVSAKNGVFKNEHSKILEVNEFLDDLLDNIDNLENIKDELSESDVDLGLDLEKSENNKKNEGGFCRLF